jgi:hypothetical protein
VDKIYFSKISDPDLWDDQFSSYYLPFAQKIASMKYGWKVIKIYIWIRMKLDGTL